MKLSDFIEELPIAAANALAEELADAVWLAAQGFFAVREAPVEPEPLANSEAGKTPSARSSVSRRLPPPPPPRKQTVASGADEPESRASVPVAELRTPVPYKLPVGGAAGVRIQAPAPRALPASRAILRALRILRRWVPSYSQNVIDEESTAHDIAQCNVWFPTLRPARSRWLDLAIVIDESLSMWLWRDTLRELTLLFGQTGAFRDIRLWWLDTDQPQQALLRARPSRTGNSIVRTPGELVSPDGRRIVLIATDCIASAWDSGAACELMDRWGRRQPVALLQMLPPAMWSRTSLDPGRNVDNGYAGAKEPGAANSQLIWRDWRTYRAATTDRNGNDSDHAKSNVAIPVVTAEPESLGRWARLLRLGGAPGVPAVRLPNQKAALPPPPSLRELASSPAEALDRYRLVSSRLAYRLARLLAAAPLLMPVMRLVQETMLPEARQVHMAEFLLGGLVRRSDDEQTLEPDRIQFDFIPGVRELLLNQSVALESIKVQRAVDRYIANHLGQAPSFDAVLAAPEQFDLSTMGARNATFARVSAEVLKRLGGQYAGVAARLSGRSSPAGPRTLPAAAPTPLTGKRLLWVNTGTEIDSAESTLTERGASLEHARSVGPAQEYCATRTYDAIIVDSRSDDRVFSGVEFMDWMSARSNFTPVALYTRLSTELQPVAVSRRALVCTRDADQLLKALETFFLYHPDGRVSPPSHLPESCDAEVSRLVRHLGMDDRVQAEETMPDGSLNPESTVAWRRRWQRLARFRLGTTLRKEITSMFRAASGSRSVRLLRNAKFLAGAPHLSDLELKSLRESLPQGQAFHVPDTRSARRSDPFPFGVRTWLILPLGGEHRTNDRILVQIDDPKALAFDPRHLQWLRMLADSLPAELRWDDHKVVPPLEWEALFSQWPLSARPLILLRTGLRLEGLSRVLERRRPLAQRNSCRALLECTEALLELPRSRPTFTTPVYERLRALQAHARSDLDISRFPLLHCALQFSVAASSYVLGAAAPGWSDQMQACKTALSRLSNRIRRRIETILMEEGRRTRSLSGLPAIQLMGDLGSLWAERTPSAPQSPQPLPVGIRPSAFVLVAGQTDALAYKPICEALGRMLAAAGFGLITGGYRGVDAHVTSGFLERFVVWDAPLSSWHITVRSSELTSRNESSQTDVIKSDWLATSFERARAVVLVGGGPFTELVGNMAIETGTFVIPLARTGGAAQAIHRAMYRRLSPGRSDPDGHLRAAQLHLAGDDPYAAITMLPDAIRRIGLGTLPVIARMSDERADRAPSRNVVGLPDLGPEPMAGLVLEKPPLIVSHVLHGDLAPKSEPNQAITIVDASGRRHFSTEVLRLRHEFGELIVLQRPSSLGTFGAECLPTPLRLGQFVTMAGIHLTRGHVAAAWTSRIRLSRRPMRSGSNRLFAIDARERQLQGTPVFDEQGRARGVLGINPYGEYILVPVSLWYRALLLTYASRLVVSPDKVFTEPTSPKRLGRRPAAKTPRKAAKRKRLTSKKK